MATIMRCQAGQSSLCFVFPYLLPISCHSLSLAVGRSLDPEKSYEAVTERGESPEDYNLCLDFRGMRYY